MPAHTFIPPVAQDMIDRLTEWGLAYEVVTKPGVVILVYQDARVRATAEYRNRPGKGWYHADAVLTVDGQRCQTAYGMRELVQIVADPDAHLAQGYGQAHDYRTCEIPPYTAVQVAWDDFSIPRAVRYILERLTRTVGADEQWELRVEQPDDQTWQVRMSGLNGMQLVVIFAHRHNGWMIKRIALIEPGQSDALDLGTSLREALALMSKPDTDSQVKQIGTPHQAPRGKNDTLAVRRNTVIHN